MAYKKTIPGPSDKLSSSQSDIKTNFEEIDNLIKVDHATFGTTNEGKHDKASFPKQGAAPATLADEVVLYCKDDIDGNPSLFARKESNGDEVNLIPSGTSVSHTTKGYEKFPSGLMMCWGSKACGVGCSGTSDTFAKTFKAGSPFQVITSASGVGGGKTDAQNVAFATSYTTTIVSFNRSRSENGFTLRYLAIGLEA